MSPRSDGPRNMENHENLNRAIVSDGHFLFAGNDWRCAIGPGGVKTDKKEGDGATPAGSFHILKLFYRADKGGKPETAIPAEKISLDDGWCDEPGDPNYNQLVKLPYDKSHEDLWRPDDDLYDLIGVLDYNYPEAEPGKGSCVFLHVARETYSPTGGCIAMSKEDLLAFLKLATPETVIEVKP